MNKYFLVFLLSISLFSDQNLNIKLKNYQAQGFDKESGFLSWIIFGSEAIIYKNKYELFNVEINFFNKNEKQVIKTKSCYYDIDKELCSSRENIIIIGKNFIIKGKGFDIDNNNNKVYVRNQVKVIWNLE